MAERIKCPLCQGKTVILDNLRNNTNLYCCLDCDYEFTRSYCTKQCRGVVIIEDLVDEINFILEE